MNPKWCGIFSYLNQIMYSRAKLMVRIRRMKNVSSVLKVRLFSQVERRATAKKRKCKYLWRIKVPFSQMRDGSPYNKRKLSLEWWGRLLYRMYYSSRCTHANNMSFKWPNKKENRSFVRLKFFFARCFTFWTMDRFISETWHNDTFGGEFPSRIQPKIKIFEFSR